jgi:hypothetical protein
MLTVKLVPGGGDNPLIESLQTLETNTNRVLVPDGAGGVQWVCYNVENFCTTELVISKYLAPDGAGGLQWLDLALWSLDNTIYIDPDETEIAGRIYQSIANALAYLAGLPGPQQPSKTNRWTIVVGGTNNESFTLPSWVRVEGNGSTVLTGAIDTAGGFAGELYEYFITRCELSDIALTGGNHLTLVECVVDGNAGNSVAGTIYAIDCLFIAGDLSNILFIAGIECTFLDTVFSLFPGSSPQFINCVFTQFTGAGCTLAPGSYSECYIYNGTMLADTSERFDMDGGFFEMTATVSDGCTWIFRDVLITRQIVVAGGVTGGTLETRGCVSNTSSIPKIAVTSPGKWINKGDLVAKARLVVSALIASGTTLNTNASGAGYTHSGDGTYLEMTALDFQNEHSIRILVNGVEQDKQTAITWVSQTSFQLPSLALNAGDIVTIYN